MEYSHLKITPVMDSTAEGDFRSTKDFLFGFFEEKEYGLQYRYDAETVLIEPWGKNSLRIRAWKCHEMPTEPWALDSKPEKTESIVKISQYSAQITNGNITAKINNIGKISFYWQS